MYQFSLHQYFVYAVAISINKCFLLCCHFIISSFRSVAVVACLSWSVWFPLSISHQVYFPPLSTSLTFSLPFLSLSLSCTHSRVEQTAPPIWNHSRRFTPVRLQRFLQLGSKDRCCFSFFGQKWSLGVFLIKTSARSKKYLTPNFLWSQNLASEKKNNSFFFQSLSPIFFFILSSLSKLSILKLCRIGSLLRKHIIAILSRFLHLSEPEFA